MFRIFVITGLSQSVRYKAPRCSNGGGGKMKSICIAWIVLVLGIQLLYCTSAGGVSNADIRRLRDEIRDWAKQFRCEGMTPTHKPEDCANPKRGDSTGDSILFSAILYYSGEKWAARNIYESMDEQGGMWRSPQRRRSRCDGSWGRSRFSQDAMLGVLQFLVTE